MRVTEPLYRNTGTHRVFSPLCGSITQVLKVQRGIKPNLTNKLILAQLQSGTICMCKAVVTQDLSGVVSDPV